MQIEQKRAARRKEEEDSRKFFTEFGIKASEPYYAA